jgi:hypothetical protein
MKERIEVGDYVSVEWETISWIHRARVVSIPCNTGDSWILYDEDNNKTYYVSLFYKMEKLKP